MRRSPHAAARHLQGVNEYFVVPEAAAAWEVAAAIRAVWAAAASTQLAAEQVGAALRRLTVHGAKGGRVCSHTVFKPPLALA